MKISFAEFMKQALYDPENGYYASGHVQIGKSGDFFTNVSVGKIYGKILALFFEELWEKMKRPKLFTIVEQGAHDGRLASDILEAAASAPLFLKSIHYYIVEPFACHRKEQQNRLNHHHDSCGKNYQNTFFVENLDDLPEFEGIHFSNELLDAFPIDLLRWDGKEWLEQRVLITEKKPPSWITAPIKQEELHLVAKKLPYDLAPPFLWEVRLGISHWLQTIATKMKRGMVLIVDYGYAGDDRFASYRAKGSIACYQNHRRYDNPLEQSGKRDITAHVDFTDLAEKALQHHFEILGYSDQHYFLIGASEAWLRTFEGKSLSHSEQRELRLLQTLLHPETMGRSFKFLGLKKNLSLLPTLSGFHYQRPGVSYLKPTPLRTLSKT